MPNDFLTDLEDALGNIDDLESCERMQVDSDGEGGILHLVLTSGRSYSVQFNRQ